MREEIKLKIVPPTECPSCGFKLELVKDQLFCRNTECVAQNSKRVQHFAKKLKIKGFGEVTLEKLELSSIPELLNYTAKYGVDCGLGLKTAQNLEDSVKDFVTTGAELAELIAALGIDLIGDSAGRKLQDTVGSLLEIDASACQRAGLGEKATASLLKALACLDPVLFEITIKSAAKQHAVAQEAKGDICITGKLKNYKNRIEAGKFLQSLGWNVKDSVTKTVRILICEDGNTTSSSYIKAINNNIEVLTIEELISKG